MVALYTVFLLLGLLVFVVALVGNVDHDFGHAMDFGHHDVSTDTDSPGLFSIRTISAFLAGFGVSGLVAVLQFHWGILGQLALGFGTGLVLSALAYGIMYAFYSQQGWKLTDSKTFAGMSAVITTPSGTQGIGECKVDNKYYSCKEKTNQPLLINDAVKVSESLEGILIVEKSIN